MTNPSIVEDKEKICSCVKAVLNAVALAWLLSLWGQPTAALVT
jgi:hypothetical protein